jgi:hypothetical protein
MVKNYLVCAIRPIKEGWHLEKRQDLFEKYHEMYAMGLASFKKFVLEPFEAVLWTEPVDNNDQYTEHNWDAIKKLWHQEPCNIFWAGADTLMIKPTSLFGEQFKEYRMFNYTDPRSHREFEHHFNDDVQYYPHTMSEETWAVGETYWAQRENHPDRPWGFDQLRHNAMFWAQDIPDTDRWYPKLAYQAFSANIAINGDRANIKSLRDFNLLNRWNGVDVQSAHILHFHASRGTDQVIDIMKHLCQQTGITV